MPKRKTPSQNDKDKALSRRNLIIGSIVGITVILTFIIELPQKINASIDVFKATETLTTTNTPEPPPTETVLPSATLSAPQPTEISSETPVLEVIPATTDTPIAMPTLDTHLGIENGCIDYRFWSSKDDTGIAADSNGCLQLLDWGFFAQDKKLYLLPLKNYDGRSHGLHTSISGDVDINFLFQVDKIQTGTRQANVRFGVVSKNYSDGKFLAYHYLPDYPNNLYPKLFENGNYGDPFSVNLEIGKAQQVTISVRGNFLTIILDGEVVLDKMVLRFDNRLFSIDYFLPPSSDLSAYISEFSIERK